MVKITDRDRGFNKLKRALYRLNRAELLVGIQGQEAQKAKNKGRSTLLNVAVIHEFGVPGRIPQRSFLRAWADENRREIQKEMREFEIKLLGSGGNWLSALNRLGLKSVGLIQERISIGIPPALSEKTIARKKSSKPLIDTGQLRTSITHRIRF